MNSGVNWNGVSHQEMYDKINGGAGVSSLSTASGAWASLSQVLRAADFSVRRISEQAAANWKGEGSESLQSATSPFAIGPTSPIRMPAQPTPSRSPSRSSSPARGAISRRPTPPRSRRTTSPRARPPTSPASPRTWRRARPPTARRSGRRPRR